MSTNFPSAVCGAMTTAALRRTVVHGLGSEWVGVCTSSVTTARCLSAKCVVVDLVTHPFSSRSRFVNRILAQLISPRLDLRFHILRRRPANGATRSERTANVENINSIDIEQRRELFKIRQRNSVEFRSLVHCSGHELAHDF